MAEFDYIFIAPPQYEGLWLKAFKVIDEAPEKFLREFGEVIVQIDPKELRNEEVDQWEPTHLTKIGERQYGRTLIQFYTCEEDETG